MPEAICFIATLIAVVMGIMSLYSMLISWRLFHAIPTNTIFMIGLCVAISVFDYKSEIHHHGIKHAYVRMFTTITSIGIASFFGFGFIDRLFDKINDFKKL